MAVDPLSDIFARLRVEATRVTRLAAAGDWALSFPPLERLKFVAVTAGRCWLLREADPPLSLAAGDLILVGRIPYAVASDPSARAVPGQPLFDGRDDLRIGEGDEAVLLGGGVAFAAGTSSFVLDMLPDFVRFEASQAGPLALVLSLLDRESDQQAAGFVAASRRLAELLIIEAIRSQLAGGASSQTGWLGALSDPRLARALTAFHADIAAPWTVEMLASEAGMSRAAFSAAFLRVTARSPNAYLRSWRLTLARAMLDAGQPITVTAAAVGYGSTSAFGHAFRQAFGAPPGALGSGRKASR